MLRLKRESFASRIGFLMVSAGCAIGIGNVWRFPTVTGQYGGGVFVLFYLLFLVLMGAPVLTMELAVGRAGHGSAGTAYRALEPKGSKWHLHGWACLIGCCVLMMYYTTVSGWMLAYFFRFVKGTFTGLAADAVSGVYADLLPDWNRAAEMGIGNVIVAAMNQAFFTLSLGVGAMEIFGSYMSRDYTLAGESLRICALDTCVAICSGLIIFPACFSYGVSPDAGPKLIFITLPNVFANMTGGRLWGTLFFVFMTFASFSTIIAVFQNILACLQESFGWSLKRACAVGTVFILLASVPCILGFNLWSSVQPMGPGSTVLDAEDFLVSNLLLPIGSLIYLLFCVTRWGWGFDNYLTEANTGKGLRLPRWFKPYFSVVLPLLIVFILVQGL